MTRLSPSGNVNSTQNSHFLPDPLTNKLVKWDDPKSLAFTEGVKLCPSAKGANFSVGQGFDWVPMDCTDYVSWPGANACYIPGNVTLDEYCVAKGYSKAGVGCKHDEFAPAGTPNVAYAGIGYVGAVKFTNSPYNNRWVVNCGTHWWQIPDFIQCMK